MRFRIVQIILIATSFLMVSCKSEAEKLIEELKVADVKKSIQIQDSLIAIGQPAIQVLIEAPQLYSSEKEVYNESIIQVLSKMGDPAIEALISALDHKNSSVARESARRLGELKAKAAVLPLIAYLERKNPWAFEEYAILALGKLEDLRAGDILLRILNEEGSFSRIEAAISLGMIREPRAVKPLIEVWNEFDRYSGWFGSGLEVVEEALIRIGTPAIKQLVLALESEYPRVRMSAQRALFKTGLTSVDTLVMALKNTKFENEENERAFRQFLEAFEKKNTNKIRALYQRIIKLGKPGSEAVLSGALEQFGDLDMASVYANCGNDRLNDAARLWARRNNYIFFEFPGSSSNNIMWGLNR